MTEKYRLVEDGHRNEWRLLKQGADYAESIFVNLDDAIRKLPDAIGNVAAVVEILDCEGAICGQRFIDPASQSNREFRYWS